MSDIATVSQKIQEALDAVNALRASLEQLAEKSAVDVPQPGTEKNTVSQPADDTTQKVPAMTPTISTTTGGNFSA